MLNMKYKHDYNLPTTKKRGRKTWKKGIWSSQADCNILSETCILLFKAIAATENPCPLRVPWNVMVLKECD